MKRLVFLILSVLPLSAYPLTEAQQVVQQTFDCGAQIRIVATPADGYRFVRWSDGNTNPVRTVTVGSEITFSAEFAEEEPSGCTGVTASGNCGAQGDNLTWQVSCDNTLTISGTGSMADYSGSEVPWHAYAEDITAVVVDSRASSNSGSAFIGCVNIKSMTAPASFFEVQESALPYCTKQLESVTVSNGVISENGLRLINRSCKTLKTIDVSAVTNTVFADGAFSGCYSLTDLRLPSSLKKISYMMAAGCKNLQEAVIPAAVTEIEQSAYEDCRSLQSVTFEGTALRRIGEWAFYNAHTLQHLTVPEGVTEIGDGAFYGCVYLADITLPSTLRTVGDNSFALCTRMAKITSDAVVPPALLTFSFYEVKRTIPVYVPDESVDAYLEDIYWREFDIQGKANLPTALGNTEAQDSVTTRKIMRDGHVFIIRGDKVYTVTGMEVNKK